MREANHVPPIRSLRSKTRMVSNFFSRTRACTAETPDGPAPITATRLTLSFDIVRFLKSASQSIQLAPARLLFPQQNFKFLFLRVRCISMFIYILKIPLL